MDSLYVDYENSLIGRSKKLSSYNFYGPDASGANQQRAIKCIRYAFEEILELTPTEVIQKLDLYLINEMKLDKVLKYIIWNEETGVDNMRYLLSLMYPSIVKINPQKLIEEIYERVLKNEGQFPRDFFAGSEGFYRYCACIEYLMENYKSFYNAGEVYDFFLSTSGRKFLTRYKLMVPARQLQISLLDCIHEITRDDEGSDVYYNFYDFSKKLDDLYKDNKNLKSKKNIEHKDENNIIDEEKNFKEEEISFSIDSLLNE